MLFPPLTHRQHGASVSQTFWKTCARLMTNIHKKCMKKKEFKYKGIVHCMLYLKRRTVQELHSRVTLTQTHRRRMTATSINTRGRHQMPHSSRLKRMSSGSYLWLAGTVCLQGFGRVQYRWLSRQFSRLPLKHPHLHHPHPLCPYLMRGGRWLQLQTAAKLVMCCPGCDTQSLQMTWINIIMNSENFCF